MTATWKGRKGLNLAHETMERAKLGNVGRPSDREPAPIKLFEIGFQHRRFPNEMAWSREVIPAKEVGHD